VTGIAFPARKTGYITVKDYFPENKKIRTVK